MDNDKMPVDKDEGDGLAQDRRGRTWIDRPALTTDDVEEAPTPTATEMNETDPDPQENSTQPSD